MVLSNPLQSLGQGVADRVTALGQLVAEFGIADAQGPELVEQQRPVRIGFEEGPQLLGRCRSSLAVSGGGISNRADLGDPAFDLAISDRQEELLLGLEVRVERPDREAARNLPYYPQGVKVTGVELSPEMAELGRKRAQRLGREIEMQVGDAEALDFPDQSLDTVVCTYGLCTIPDDAPAVREAKRVLRPGGRILLAEHVRSPNLIVRTIQRVLEPFAHRLGGDHLLREPLDHLTQDSFQVETVKRSKAGWVELVAAKKPA